MHRKPVLLVDDDSGLRGALVRSLRRTFRITDVGSVAEAVAVLAESASFAAVITDFEMPSERGDVLVTWVMEHRPEFASRILVMTGGTVDPAGLVWLRSFDPKRVLTKPCLPQQLREAIERVLAP